MFRRVLTPRHIDADRWATAAERKHSAVCGGTCFCFGLILLFSMVSTQVITRQALIKHGPLAATLSCTEPSQEGPPPHYIEGCFLSTMFVGRFTMSTKITLCGDLGHDVAEGRAEDGHIVSFFGDASGGLLRPWTTPGGLSVCEFERGSIEAGTLVTVIMRRSGEAFLVGIAATGIFTAFSAQYLLHLKSQKFILAFVAMLVTCFLGMLHAYVGPFRLWLGCLPLLLFLSACMYADPFESSVVRRITGQECAPALGEAPPDLEATERTPTFSSRERGREPAYGTQRPTPSQQEAQRPEEAAGLPGDSS